MKRIDGAVALSLSLSLCGAAFAQTENLITNPGFEQSGSGWTLWTEPSDTVAVSAVTYPDSGAHAGTRYARVDVTTPSMENANWRIQFQPPAQWTALMGGTYEMTFWAKSDSSTNLHFSVQDGPDNMYEYRSGFDFGLTPEWTEYYFSYTSDVEGYGALRFFLYVGATVDTYGFDEFKLVEYPPVNIRDGATPARRQSLHVTREQGHLVLTLDEGAANHSGTSGTLSAGLFDARGASVATATSRADGTLQLAYPGRSGTYFVRASAGTKVWVRQVTVR